MSQIGCSYPLPVGSSALYPPVDVLDPNPPAPVPFDNPNPFTSINDVIVHYTSSSLQNEGFQTLQGLSVTGNDTDQDPLTVNVLLDESELARLQTFGDVHQAFLRVGFKAWNGAAQMQNTPGAWNPMAGYPVNKHDGVCKWSLCLPLGMAMVSQAAVILMHYPPYIAMQKADYLHNNTLERWQNLLTCCGLGQDMGPYTTIVDVNPIAAPGSGQSEYPNDYFPIMMSSVFFDNASNSTDYIRSMLMLLLTPGWAPGQPTLPLLVCGSPLYDPQATGWFRVAYKDQMPPGGDPPGIPQANVMQVGYVSLVPQAPQTPYMIANHMIAAGVTGRNTGADPANGAKLPDIRQYEGQDLSTAEYLHLLGKNPGMNPSDALAQACLRWYGNPQGTGNPVPPDPTDRASLCAMALVDLFFNVKTVKPWYTLQEAQTLVQAKLAEYGDAAYNPCDTTIYPNPVPPSH